MATSSGNLDWQIGLKCVKDRASKVLDSGQWSDCVFIVGTEGRQETVQAHKLILAMASPVFEAMFYGSLADKDEKPIEILDVQPQAFRALLKYLYTDEINFLSFDQVCEICYAAKKYMIPPLVEECTKYIWKDLHPGNVCRAFAFVRLFEEPRLLEQCMQMIKTLTEDVVRDQSFEEVDTNTLKAILSQETLNVGEMDLWDGVVRWSKQECIRQSLDVNPVSQRKVMQDLLPLFRTLCKKTRKRYFTKRGSGTKERKRQKLEMEEDIMSDKFFMTFEIPETSSSTISMELPAHNTSLIKYEGESITNASLAQKVVLSDKSEYGEIKREAAIEIMNLTGDGDDGGGDVEVIDRLHIEMDERFSRLNDIGDKFGFFDVKRLL